MQLVTVNFRTNDNGSASALSDYEPIVSGMLTFAPGETSKQITVAVTGDQKAELNETFSVDLSRPSNATITDSRGVATILNDDLPSLGISDTVVAEGDTGVTSALFTVVLSNTVSVPVTVHYATSDTVPTTAPVDYIASSGTLTFAPGETSKQIAVSVRGDLIDEPLTSEGFLEAFFVTLSGAINATIMNHIGAAVILNDDGAFS